ncbi:MAG TPA: MazG family protein [Candidatus Limnocylindria bacterium]|nr:MazG family protein [Candidatus Limnocylindria bacterium]
MPKPPSSKFKPIEQVRSIMATLRSPEGCPWDREQDHLTLRWHAVEEVYELMDAIEAGDEEEMAEELGDLLLQVVFHAQLAAERGVFDFDAVCLRLSEKLVRRHPHVFGDIQAKDIDQVWANWEKIKKAEKAGSAHERKSALDGIPSRLPALMRAQKLLKKASKAGLVVGGKGSVRAKNKAEAARQLFELAAFCQEKDWSAEELLRGEIARRERKLRATERKLTREKAKVPIK